MIFRVSALRRHAAARSPKPGWRVSAAFAVRFGLGGMDSAEILVYWRFEAAGISESGDVPNGYAVNAKTFVFAAADS